MFRFSSFFILACCGLFLLPGCTGDFDELNTNPNAPNTVAAELLLRQVIFDYADESSYEGFTGGANLGQYFSADPGFNRFDRGDLLAPQFGSNPWPALYTQLRDLNLLLAQARSNETERVYEGPALVLRSLVGGNLTDLFGDVPFSAAGRGREGATAPTYDTQQDIYTGVASILADLKLAVEVMDGYTGVAPLAGDELYGGDLTAWIRMANSLRLRYLLRASNVLDAGRLAELQDILDEGRILLTGDQDAVFAFGTAPNDFRFVRARVGDFRNYFMSETLDDQVDQLADPREQRWFRPAQDGSFNGLPHGLTADTSLFQYSLDSVSFPGLVWREEATQLRANFVTAWETHFVLAEAALKGLVTGASAKTWYDEGVRLAFAYWGTALPADYLSSGPAAFESRRGLEQVATQRWLASIGAGYEGWIEWRRTGFPAFAAPVTSLNDGRWPIRFPYPVEEQALNEAAYLDAIDRLGGSNSPNVAVWWDN